MEVKVMIHCPSIEEDELLKMLQAVRDAEQAHFKKKTIGIFIETNPEMSTEEAGKLLSQITPPFAQQWEIDRK